MGFELIQACRNRAVDRIRAACIAEAYALCGVHGMLAVNVLAEQLADRAASALQEERSHG